MRNVSRYFGSFGLLVTTMAFAAAACGGSGRRSGYDDDDVRKQTEVDGGGGGGGGFGNDETPCTELECLQVTCEGGGTTTLTGKVYDPAGKNPLYNVAVYIPKSKGEELPPISSSLTDGVQCETCASVVVNPLVSTLTDTSGSFELTNVPVAEEVPVVIQIGKWRRKFTVDVTEKCAENKVEDKSFRLPKNGKEGDMPHIAVAMGGCDSLECLLEGIGIDQSEFVAGDDPSGHVHVFSGRGGTGFSGAPDASNQLWNSVANMAKYDIVMFSCECSEYDGIIDSTSNKGQASGGAIGYGAELVEYANMGGKVFATHYHYTWFKHSPDPNWRDLATWRSVAASGGNYTLDVDTSFPKGQALAEWLVNVGASSTPGKLPLKSLSRSATAANPELLQPWLLDDGIPRYFSFNTPLEAAEADQCGRTVYGDLHLLSSGSGTFPNRCPGAGKLNEQQAAMEFLFFDLSSCVQADNVPPSPPK